MFEFTTENAEIEINGEYFKAQTPIKWGVLLTASTDGFSNSAIVVHAQEINAVHFDIEGNAHKETIRLGPHCIIKWPPEIGNGKQVKIKSIEVSEKGQVSIWF